MMPQQHLSIDPSYLRLQQGGTTERVVSSNKQHQPTDRNSASARMKTIMSEARLGVDSKKSKAPDSDELRQKAFDVVCTAFAQILGIDDRASITVDTDFFAEGGGSLQISELQGYLAGDNEQDFRLRHKLEQ